MFGRFRSIQVGSRSIPKILLIFRETFTETRLTMSLYFPHIQILTCITNSPILSKPWDMCQFKSIRSDTTSSNNHVLKKFHRYNWSPKTTINTWIYCCNSLIVISQCTGGKQIRTNHYNFLCLSYLPYIF